MVSSGSTVVLSLAAFSNVGLSVVGLSSDSDSEERSNSSIPLFAVAGAVVTTVFAVAGTGSVVNSSPFAAGEEALVFSVGSASGARPPAVIGFGAFVSAGKSNSSAPKIESFGTDPDTGGWDA